MVVLFSVLLSACCRNEIAPILDTPQIREASADDVWMVSLDDIILDSSLPIEELTISVNSSNPDVVASHDQSWIFLTPNSQPFNGRTTLEVTVTDRCEQQSIESFEVVFGSGISENDPTTACQQQFTYLAPEGTTAVYLAGDFNDWNTTSHPLELNEGIWQTEIELDTETAYKFVVEHDGITDWTCNPTSDWYQCDPGQPFLNTCDLGDGSCNSIATVECATVDMELIEWSIENDQLRLSLASESALSNLEITYNGIAETYDWSETLQIPLASTDRHTLYITGTNAEGQASEPIYLPFWTDAFDWNSAVIYFPFVDRFANGDPSNDLEYGTNWYTGDYLGGDWQGIINRLPYLEDMGVTALWINSPLNNPDGIYEGSCGMSITGYHGYWPQSNTLLEEHFGDQETLRRLITEAHDRGIRVLVDWVGNHTHDTHAWFEEHPEWYTDQQLCTDNDNWNQAPETCWFAPYVPTLNYAQPSAMVHSIKDALDFAIDYDIDGFRVDAVKHMPMAVHWNLQRQIANRIEHSSNTPFDFYTVGETFSGDRGLLRDYVGPELLDGQFDFALYWKILEVLARGEGSLADLETESQQSLSFFEGHTMSNFLGNHDVERFITHASGEVSSLYGDGLCPNGDWRVDAMNPDWDEPYQRLQLAWTWLLTHPGASLVYYGDEIGLPGYHDPDNRQMMQWDWTARQSAVHNVVQTLANARQEYPQLTSKNRTTWWESDDVLGIAISENNQHALVLLNRSGTVQTISNGLSWAGLPTNGTIQDLLSGNSMSLNSDSISFTLHALGVSVWIWE